MAMHCVIAHLLLHICGGAQVTGALRRDRRVTVLLHTCCCTLVAVHTCGGAQVTGALRLSGEQQGADIAMIVLGGIAGAVMVMHCVMAVWDTTELALETEKLKRQPKKGPLCNAV
eukprot:scaffold103666_cov21-Tisochrysis_lutea.AAC.2